jgi:peptide chain release factor 1
MDDQKKVPKKAKAAKPEVRVLSEEETRAQEESASRKLQVRTVDRSERIRTYNFPENRLTDHRTGYKSHNLDQILNGDLDPVLQSCVDMEITQKLAEVGETR